MHALHKAYSILKNGMVNDPEVLLRYVASFLAGTRPSSLHFYSTEELSKKIINGASVIRMGDGEVMLMLGRDIHYQKAEPSLSVTLRNILTSYNTQASYILAMPYEALTATDATLKEKKRFRIWRLFRCFATQHLNTTLPYADAHSFYHQAFLQSLLPALLKDRQVLCICRPVFQDTVLRNYLEAFGATVHFIPCNDTDAYSDIRTLQSAIDKHIADSSYPPLLLLAAGPTSKVLAFHYQAHSVQSIDIGHGIEIVGRSLDYSNRV